MPDENNILEQQNTVDMSSCETLNADDVSTAEKRRAEKIRQTRLYDVLAYLAKAYNRDDIYSEFSDDEEVLTWISTVYEHIRTVGNNKEEDSTQKQIRDSIINLLDDYKFVYSTLTRFDIDIQELCLILCRQYGSIFRSKLFLKKLFLKLLENGYIERQSV